MLLAGEKDDDDDDVDDGGAISCPFLELMTA